MRGDLAGNSLNKRSTKQKKNCVLKTLAELAHFQFSGLRRSRDEGRVWLIPRETIKIA